MMYLPELYEQVCLQAEEDAVIALNTYFKHIKINDHCYVLDIGCGPGNITNNLLYPAFPKTIKKLIGLDISEEMIKYAKKNFANTKLSFRVMDVTTTTIPEEFLGAFDHAVSLYCFQNVFNQRQALSNVFKMLKPGGNIFFNFIGNGIHFDVYKSLKEEREWKHYLEHYDVVAPHTHGVKDPSIVFEQLLKDIGFESHFCIPRKKIYVYSRELYKNLLLAINFFRFPKILEKAYVNYHLNFLKKKNLFREDGDGNEYYHYEYTLLTVYASKPL